MRLIRDEWRRTKDEFKPGFKPSRQQNGPLSSCYGDGVMASYCETPFYLYNQWLANQIPSSRISQEMTE